MGTSKLSEIQLSNKYDHIFYFASCPKHWRVENRHFRWLSPKKSKW